jgi:phosphate/phosphite/phosphonate ABC transporter binding protein
MTRLAALGCLVAALGCSSSSSLAAREGGAVHAASRPRRIIIGLPDYGGLDAVRAWLPLVAYLQAKLGISIAVRAAEPYTKLPALLRSGAVDVAQIPPLAYVTLHEEDPGITPLATPIVGSTPTYLGHVYVLATSPYQVLEDLRGKRMAYVDAHSSSSYLFPRDLLRRHGLDPDTFFGSVRFYESHAQVLAAIASGEVDAGAAVDGTSGWSGVATRPKGLRVIAKTERIPNDCLAARAGLDAATATALQEALVSLRIGDPKAEALLAPWHVNGWVRADGARYESIRAVLARDGHSGHK